MALGRSLFRQEAIEFQRGQREFGEIALLQPVSTKLLAWLLAAVVTIAIVFLCFAQFSRKQTVSGFLTPAAGTLKVFPDREGVVTNLYVKEGQEVKAGDPLFTVGTPQIAADGEDVNAAKLASLKQQKEALGHQIPRSSKAPQRNASASTHSSPGPNPRSPICVGRSSCKANASSLPKVLLRPRRTFSQKAICPRSRASAAKICCLSRSKISRTSAAR